MVINNNNPGEFKEQMQKYQDYVGALEEERRKIQVFERELPLCLHLVSQAIDRCRHQMSSGTITNRFNGDQYSEHTSSDGPVLEEFIPMKRLTLSTTKDDSDKHKKHQFSHKPKICSKDKSSPSSTKSDWLTSAQLSIQPPDPPIEKDLLSKNLLGIEACDAYHPFIKERSSGAAPSTGVEKGLVSSCAAISSSADTDGGGGENKGEVKKQCNKKARRCWSPELHRRFLHALQQLGGAHVATPKQIREFMKVDGLTNDEIKSHLQKYRLHTRRVNHPTIHSNDQHTPQLVVVGQIWMPPLDYNTNINLSPTSNDTNVNAKGVYAPISSFQQSISASLYNRKRKQQSRSEEIKGS